VLLIEPVLHGSMSNIDDALDALAKATEESFPDRDTWGITPGAREGAQAAESAFPMAQPRPDA